MPDLDSLVLGPCMTAWGESVTFQPLAGAPQVITGVFSEKFREITFADGNPLVDNKPVLGCRASAFNQQPQKYDQLVFRGVTWSIEVVEPDGQGHLHLQLRLGDDTQLGLTLAPPAPPTAQ